MRITLPENGSAEQCWRVYRLANALLNIHGLSNWTIKWDRSKNRAGQTRHWCTTISLSAPLMSVWTTDKARELILHEIAHALSGEGNGHNDVWRKNCRMLGIKPSRCWTPTADSPHISAKYIGHCSKGHVHYRNRITKKAHRVSCAMCAPYFNAAYKIKWSLND